MLTGEYRHTLDDKSRITLPARLRRELQGKSRTVKMVVCKGYDGCLFLFDQKDWETYLHSELQKERDLKSEARAIKRFFSASSFEIDLDRQGRFLIPPALKAWAKIGRDAVLLGVIDRVEIWNPGRWKKLNADMDIEKIAESLVGGFSK